MRLSTQDKILLRSILPEYLDNVPVYMTEKNLAKIEWRLFLQHNLTIMEVLQKYKNLILSNIIEKELLLEEPREKYTSKYNRNIQLIIE